YAAVQAYGRATIYFDSSSDETSSFLSTQINDLSQYAEMNIMGYTGTDAKSPPWKVTDAPDRYIQLMKKGIIGIKIAIDRLEGKFKMSQELDEGDRQGVIEGFQDLQTVTGRDMADIVKQRGDL